MTQCVSFQQTWALKGVPATAGEARRLLRQSLTDPIYADLLDDAQLAVTEIMTNVVLHTNSDLVLTLRAEHGRVCVQIRDHNSALPTERHFGVQATTGRGMALVRQVTSAHGTLALAGGGKLVWFIIGPVEVAGSAWPLLDDPIVQRPPVSAPSLPVDAVHVRLDGAASALWLAALADADEILRELAHFHSNHPDEGITRAELALAEQARAHGMLAVGQAVTSTGQVTDGTIPVSLWVTVEQCTYFDALSDLFMKADQLTNSNRLLRTNSDPACAALRNWALDQVRVQVQGQPARAWNHHDALAEFSTSRQLATLGGWDTTSVTTSDRSVIAFDASYRIVAVSQPLASLLGWRAEHLVGRLTTALIPARLRQAHLADFKAFLSTGASPLLGKSLPLPILQSDGAELPCHVRITQVGNRVGHPVFLTHMTPAGDPTDDQDPQAPEHSHHGERRADLGDFSLTETVRMAAAIRNLGGNASSTQNFANTLCRYLNDQFRDEAGMRQSALVRFYATLRLDELPPADEALVHEANPGGLPADTICLVLLAAAGTQPTWNDRTASQNTRVIALTDPAQFTALPVLNALMEQIGLEPSGVLRSWHDPAVPKPERRYGVFHVNDQTMAPDHPTYRFSRKHHIKSLIGFGGGLPGGGLFGIAVYSRVSINAASAKKFQALAHSAAFGGFARSGIPVFEGGPRTDRPGHSLSACQRTTTQNNILMKLLEDHEWLTATESDAAAQALERSRFDTQRYAALARTLQVVLLPKDLPAVPGIQTGTYFRPAGDGTEIGGDFYDLFPISENRFGFTLGDVSGKGADAAVLTAFARSTIRSAAVSATDSCQVLQRLDQAISDQETDGRYLTALFAFVTAQAGFVTLHLALGGHPRPLVIRANGTVEAMGVEGGALGLFPDPTFTQVQLKLAPGDAFVAYTDGITEARRGNEEFGEHRLRAFLSEQYTYPAETIAANLGKLLLHFQAGTTHDDAALVILRCQ